MANTVLKIENTFSQVLSEDQKIKDILWGAMRHRERNYFHNIRYKMKLWDGYVDFFKRDTGKFLTGLLPEVRLALRQMGVEYTTLDKRDAVQFTVEKVDEQWLNKHLQPGMKPVELRDYQMDYINQSIRNMRGIVYAPTIAGKTNIMIGALLTLPPNTPTLVLANRKSLVDQNYEEIKMWGINDVGRFYGDHKEIRTITCATVQSAHLLKGLFPKIKVLFVDEIHEMMSKKPRAVYNACKNASVRIGMSATPFKFGEKDKVQKYEVKGYIGPVFMASNTETGRLSTKDLQKRKILASADCFFYPVHEPPIPYHIYLDAVTDGIAQNKVFHEMTCKLVNKLEGRTLIIVERIPHGDSLNDMLPGSLWVRGQDTLDTRKMVIERLKKDDGNIVAIATSGIFNTGINVFCHNLINCAGGQAEHQIIQRFGRGLRVADDKKHLKYYDWIFTINDYLEKHSWKRVDILTNEGHNVQVMEEFDL
jgi:superfamily II DNA or RNA helicase